MRLFLLIISLLFTSCSSTTSSSAKNKVKIGKRTYNLINLATVRKNVNKADAVIVWDQKVDDATIWTTHNGERKEGTFYIPNLSYGLEKLIRGKKTIIMVIEKSLAQHSRTSKILNSLSPKRFKVYICYFNDGVQEEI